MEKTCACCSQKFIPLPTVRNQQYCSEAHCQKTRKKRWQKQKLVSDSAYRENQSDARKEWGKKNNHYWKRYRKRNPAYEERNRLLQRERNRRKRVTSVIAKMDELTPRKVIASGRYRLIPVIANMDELIVEIGVISGGFVDHPAGL
jgi:hypothetical protein